MAELIGGEGDVAVLVHDQTSGTGIDRRDGFLEQMKAKYPKIKVVSVQYGQGDQLKSTEIAKTVLQANPNLKGYYGANEGSIIGVLNAAKEMKRKVVIIGYDSGKQQKAAIADGSQAGAITQNPVGIGYKTVEAAVKALKGEKLEKIIDTGFYWYDKNNMNDPKISAVLRRLIQSAIRHLRAEVPSVLPAVRVRRKPPYSPVAFPFQHIEETKPVVRRALFCRRSG